MFKVVILVCAAALAPRDCTVHSATSVTTGPDEPNELMCGLHGQAYLAGTELVPQPGEYVKILCQRSRNVPPNLG